MMLNKNTTRVLIGLSAILILGALLVFGLRAIVPTDNSLKARVSPRSISINDSIYFSDSTEFAKTRSWHFGDGQLSNLKSGYHKFSSPGNYTVVLTVNDNLRDSFVVSVQDGGYTYTAHDSIFKIVAVDRALQGESVVFRVDGHGSQEFNWDFGDNTSPINSSNSIVQHTYLAAGKYTVKLTSRNNYYPATHVINIMEGFKVSDPTSPTAPGGGGNDAAAELMKKENDFKLHLEEIIKGSDFNTHYYYLLRKYLCGREKTIIRVNDNRTNEYYSYANSLQFNSRAVIQSVKLTEDPKSQCIVSVEVRQEN